uniref:J domain-containing protein n=1 Tax=Oryza glumipatula TaxID=40148 RepID=A0A0D9ZDI5_9ORYZ
MALRAAELRRLVVLLRGEAALPLPLAWRGRPVRTAARDDELAGKSAYEVLGVGETSSSAEIKASFHRLAKETHPDVAAAAGSSRFLQILAAYEILSDSQRRAHYDIYLRSQKRVLQKHPRPSHHVYPNPSGSGIVVTRESNVVEWLKWYRLTIDDIVTKKRVVTGSGYFDKLESELYTAIHAAYYGPDVRSVDLLPDCFEAEERSVYETPELLHLVSGRDLFGIVSLADRVQQLPDAFQEKQTLPGFKTYGISQHVSTNLEKGTVHASPVYIHKREIDKNDGPHSDAYKDIELWICGKLVATATRSPKCNCIDKSDVEDHIHVFLVPNEVASSDFTQELPILGTITGLATTGEEGSCCVYDSRGIKTHLIVKHRTLMVKHMHWYQVGDEISPCECRCSRARLPPSRYWLFEPRCYMHDTGGWYIETFGRDKKGRKILSPRQWDGSNEHSERRLHPAMYLAALAYRSLDIEDAQRKKWSITTFLELQSSHIRQLCKKIFNGGKESS